MKTITIFRYLGDLDCFVVSDEYRRVADHLGLTEWSPVVWIGRLFTLDNDYGEHWFDNWHLREPLEAKAQQRGLTEEELLIIDPERFQNGKDGPCHPPTFRKRFWTDVLRSLELSFDLLADEARTFNQERLRFLPDEYISDLEARIATLRAELEACVSLRHAQWGRLPVECVVATHLAALPIPYPQVPHHNPHPPLLNGTLVRCRLTAAQGKDVARRRRKRVVWAGSEVNTPEQTYYR